MSNDPQTPNWLHFKTEDEANELTLEILGE